MRETEISGWMMPSSQLTLTRALRLAAVAVGIGMVMAAGPVRAGDDDDDKTFEERIVEGLMKGIGGTNMENQGIDYRERSPLVVPPKIDLPPPASTSAGVNAPNWPKDPDAARRKAAIAARKKERAKEPWELGRSIPPSELDVAKTAAPARKNNDPIEPGVSNNPALSPSQLGYEGGLLGMFKGNTKEEAPFKGEPTRDSLTQPPPGYQTPSPNYAYGTGPRESLNKNAGVNPAIDNSGK